MKKLIDENILLRFGKDHIHLNKIINDISKGLINIKISEYFYKKYSEKEINQLCLMINIRLIIIIVIQL